MVAGRSQRWPALKPKGDSYPPKKLPRPTQTVRGWWAGEGHPHTLLVGGYGLRVGGVPYQLGQDGVRRQVGGHAPRGGLLHEPEMLPRVPDPPLRGGSEVGQAHTEEL